MVNIGDPILAKLNEKRMSLTSSESKLMEKYRTKFQNQTMAWEKFKSETHPIFTSQEVSWTPKEPNPLFVHIHPNQEHIARIPLLITVNNTRYVIESGGIGVQNHAIAALRCQDVFYLYDSNNKIVKTDWHKGDILKYGEHLNSEYFMMSLLYVREDAF